MSVHKIMLYNSKWELNESGVLGEKQTLYAHHAVK